MATPKAELGISQSIVFRNIFDKPFIHDFFKTSIEDREQRDWSIVVNTGFILFFKYRDYFVGYLPFVTDRLKMLARGTLIACLQHFRILAGNE